MCILPPYLMIQHRKAHMFKFESIRACKCLITDKPAFASNMSFCLPVQRPLHPPGSNNNSTVEVITSPNVADLCSCHK